jgi:hypothetical protein
VGNIIHTPENREFAPAEWDGIPRQSWFIRADSDKLLIVNHPMK